MKKYLLLIAFLATTAAASNFRINQEGRILGPYPKVTTPTLFNTPQADAIVGAMQIMPLTNPWNEDISRRPVHSNSVNIIQDIYNELSSSRRTLRMFAEMNYVLVPDSQPLVPIDFFNWPEQSDPSPYPIPNNMPIEGWPAGYGLNGQTLTQWQHDSFDMGGDRHGIVVSPGTGYFWETWEMKRLQDESWEASNGAQFNLVSNALRPAGWTSGDAAGFPMFPAVVRYDECQRGMVEHCMRIVVKHTRLGYIYPATHNASVPATTNPNVPAMGQRLRLKSSFVIPSTWTKEEKAVLLGLKKYGAMVADNGNFFSISYCPDDRFLATCFDHMSSIGISNFEVIQTTGPSEGPRSAHPPRAVAGVDQIVNLSAGANLAGAVTGGTGTVTTLWRKYSGPGTVNFATPAAPATKAAFSVAGTYILMLKASDATHAPSYSALQVTVYNNVIISSVALSASSVKGGSTVVGTVKIAAPAPAGGVKATLWTSAPAIAVCPSSITIPAGSVSGTFQITTKPVSGSATVVVYGNVAGNTKSASFSVTP